MSQQPLGRFRRSVHDVERSRRRTALGEQLGHADGRQGCPFGRFEHERVAAGDRHRNHPERHHHRKIERRETGGDSHRLAEHLAVDAAGHVLRDRAQDVSGNSRWRIRRLRCPAAPPPGPRPASCRCRARPARPVRRGASSSFCLKRNRTRARSKTGVSLHVRKGLAGTGDRVVDLVRGRQWQIGQRFAGRRIGDRQPLRSTRDSRHSPPMKFGQPRTTDTSAPETLAENFNLGLFNSIPKQSRRIASNQVLSVSVADCSVQESAAAIRAGLLVNR